MQPKLLRRAQIALLFMAFATCGVISYRYWLANQQPTRFDWHHLPKNGYEYHDTRGQVPGDPENGVKQLQRFYGLIQIYRKRHGGNYPLMTSDMMDDGYRNPAAYGFKKARELVDYLYNSDNQYGDASFRNPHSLITVTLMGYRPDGKTVGGPKPLGTRDLIGMSDLYFHKNIRVYSESHSTENPVGIYLLLWDDGTVEKLPYDKLLYVKVDASGWLMAFPGQVGLPKSGVSTYDDWYKSLGWKAGPHGVKGGGGVSDKTYNPPQNGS